MFDISEEVSKLPLKPGVYIMKNADDEIIYIGKAKKLRNRVRQYFQNSSSKTAKVKSMVKRIAEFEYIVTDSEMEALLLECNLIKKHKPYYNIMLKDDKAYPYIKVTVNESYPRIFVTRQFKKDKAKYYGPITDGTAVKETVETIHSVWPIRKCKKVFPRDFNKERPCLNYHIGQCVAPCRGDISEEEYGGYISEAMLLLEGKRDSVMRKMRNDMETAAENLEFERAAVIRDKLKSVERIAERQKMDNTSMDNGDIIAFARANGEGVAQIFFIRGSKVTGRERFFLKNVDDDMDRSEVITEFVKQFYSGTAFIPKEIILQDDIVAAEKELIEGFLSELRGGKTVITVPQKGDKKRLVDLAAKNAIITLEQAGERLKRERERTIGAAEEISKALGLPFLRRMESYDISNTQGFESVGSMVVFEDGKAKRSDYRKFKIKTVVGANDYASMREVLTRRFNRALTEMAELDEGEIGKFTKLPDLILMDGGKTQIKAAKEVMREFGVNIPVCGMVKDDRHRTRGLLYEGKEIDMPLNGEGFRLITRIQDETHRFAIEYHRTLRDKRNTRSILDDIPNIGEKRRKALMRRFGSVENVMRAEPEELAQADGMDRRSAESVYAFFRQGDKNNE